MAERSDRAHGAGTTDRSAGGPVPRSTEQILAGGMLLGEHDLTGIAAPYSSAVFVLPPGAWSDPDVHDALETWFIGAGQGLLEYDGQSFTVRAGDAFHLAARRPHRLRNTGSGDLTAFSVWWSA